MHRPAIHFSIDAWMNDAIPLFWRNQYHLFFLHNPLGPVWGPLHWGHAVSDELLKWRRLPDPFGPTPGACDAAGTWTGSVIDDGTRLHAFYTALSSIDPLRQTQARATSTDGIVWQKDATGPLITQCPDGFGPCFRDPFVWREGKSNRWNMLLGSDRADGAGGAALLYESSDLNRWDYRGVFHAGDPATSGTEFECPDFFVLGNQHVLLTSADRTFCHVGSETAGRFDVQRVSPIDDRLFYAAKTLRDGNGRRILFGWIREARSVSERVADGWAGAMSLPRVLAMGDDGMLRVSFAHELNRLRGMGVSLRDVRVGRDGWTRLDAIRGDVLEIEMTARTSGQQRLGLRLRCDRIGAGGVEVLFDMDETDRGRLHLHVYLDRSIVECAINGRRFQTRRVYAEAECDYLGIVGMPGTLVDSIDVWKLRSTTGGG